MDFILNFISEYGTQIIYAALTAIAAALGVFVKNIYKKVADDDTKAKVVKTCVLAVEQLYKDLHGKEKYDKCVESITDMLNEKGISITELEIRMLIESTVGSFNKAFEGVDDKEDEAEVEEVEGVG